MTLARKENLIHLGLQAHLVNELETQVAPLADPSKTAANLIVETANDNLTATGSTQATALALAAQTNRITTVAAGTGVLLPASLPGLEITIINHGANPLQVYPSLAASDAGATIDDVAAASGVSQMQGSTCLYWCSSAGLWYTEGLGTGYAGSLQTLSFADGLVANSGGVQAGATPITSSIARFTTVGGAGYSSVLPPAAGGLNITVINAGANVMNVFPAGSDQINALASAFPLPVGGVVEFFTTVAGKWHTIAMPAPALQIYSTNSATSGTTLSGANLTGGTTQVSLNMTGTLAGGANAQLPTVANLVTAMLAAGISPSAGQTYELDLLNTSGGAFSWTVTTNTGWTLNGTMTIAQNTFRKLYVTLTSLTTATLQSVGQYAIGAGI
jgi:hypothetical protein